MKAIIMFVLPLLFLPSLSCTSATTPENILQTDLVSSVKVDGVVYTLSIPTNMFMLEDTLKGMLEVLNGSLDEREYHFNHQQQYGFQLKADDGSIALYYPTIVQPALSTFTLPPGTKKTFEIRSLFRDGDGRLIHAGSYTLESFLSEMQSPSLALQIRALQ